MKILMCPADHFSVSYSINPWMKVGSVNQAEAMKQWQQLADVYQDLGVEVEVIQPHPALPDMVFATDQGVVRDRKIVLGRFKHPERQPETVLYSEWFHDHGYEVVTTSSDNCLEGGECLPWQDQYFLGVGFRTCTSTATELAHLLSQKVTNLELINPHFYHLDTCFFPLNNEVAFYYPAAFSDSAKEYLQKTHGNLVEFSEAEATNFAANSMVIGKTVVTQQGNPKFKAMLHKCGYQVVELEMNEFVKSGGGIHCLSLKI